MSLRDLCAGLLLLLALTGNGQAQNSISNFPSPAGRFVIRSWQTSAGLPQNTVNAVVQSADGYLWVGTQAGLARFDGARFTVFGLAEGLPSTQVLALYAGRAGRLWVGTTGGGLSLWQSGRLVTVPPEPGFNDVNVSDFAEDSTGRLWVGTSAGLLIREAERFVAFEGLKSLGRAPVRKLLCRRDGQMWIATSQGLFTFRDGQLAELAGPAGDEKLTSVYALLEDRAGQVWISIGNGKVLCYRDGGWTTYNEATGLPFAYITSLAEGADGRIWAGSLDDGLFYYDGGRFWPVREQDGLSGNAIRSLFADREGHLWVGMRIAGLNRVAEQRLQVLGSKDGLTNEFVRAVAEADDGSLWVATIGGGIYRGHPERFQPVPSVIGTITYPFFESVVKLRDGSLWWGGAGSLFHWSDGAIQTNYTRFSAGWLADSGVTALREDIVAGLWIGTSRGKLLRLRNGETQAFTNRVARGAVTALEQAADGTLWIGSVAGGLVQLRPDDTALTVVTNGLLSQEIRTLFLDRENTLWIGTGGGGLGRLKQGQLTSYTTRQGLGDDTVSQILEDDEGQLWLGCNRGIFRVSKSDLDAVARERGALRQLRAFGTGEGMPVEECSGGYCPAGLKLRSGKLCFSTVKGVVLIDPHQSETAMQPPKVLIEEVLVETKPQAINPGPEVGPGAAAVGSFLRIPPGQRDIEFHYTGLSFAAPGKVQFRFRLNGYDPEWIEAGPRRVAYYPRIPPGEYEFQVTAGNANNVWAESPAALGVTVLPYFWEARWFPVAAGLAVLGGVAGAINWGARRRYKRRLAQLETRHAIERERLRISQDMHDDIGSILTRVSILSDVGQSETDPAKATHQFGRIGTQVRAAVVALDEIVWATNPGDDNLPRFAEYVGRFADECFENTAVRCWQEMPTDLPKLPLRADIRHNVFLAVKEALNNVLKHSGATEVWLRLKLTEDEVSVEVEDNGRGFRPDAAGPGGNGLRNMQSRLAECGGRAQLTSAPGQGTRLRFVFLVPKRD